MADEADPGRRDGVAFEAERVPAGRGSRLGAAMVLIAVAGLITVALANREVPGAQPGSLAEAASAGPDVALGSGMPSASLGSQVPTPRPARTGRIPLDLPLTPLGPLALDLRPAGSHLFVHGDVFTIDAVRVAVTLQDPAGRPISERVSVRLPQGSTAFRLGSVTRFDVQFQVPDEVMGEGLWVRAALFAAGGDRITVVRQLVSRIDAVM